LNYIAITIGPIFETILSANSPAGLWCASSIFSHISKEICKEVFDTYRNKGVFIISPFYYGTKYMVNDGVGRYPDRIFLRINDGFEEEFNEAKLKSIFENIILNLSKEIFKTTKTKKIEDATEIKNVRDFLKKYIQINYIFFTKKNPEENIILEYSYYLDNLELAIGFPKNADNNPLNKLFYGYEDDGNRYVKKFFLMANTCQLLEKRDKIKELEDISNNGIKNSEFKKHNYFAVVQADGDNVSQILKDLEADKFIDESINKFSEKCIEYASNSAEEIGAYGGVTIYAGGDDLLFLAPVENSKKENIFDLCETIRVRFNETFETYIDKAKEKKEKNKNVKIPSVSFGISVNYERFPLYEALSDAAGLLFGKAKSHEGKNAISFNLHKNSIGKFGFTSTNDTEVLRIFKYLIERKGIKENNNTPDDISDQVINSIIYSLENFKKIYSTALKEKCNMEEMFKNMYDGPEHDLSRTYIGTIRKLLDEIYKDNERIKINSPKVSEKSKEEEAIDMLLILLRIAKFFSEKEGDREQLSSDS